MKRHHQVSYGPSLLWVKRYRPIEPIVPPDVGCCSKTGHGFASQQNVAKGHVWTAPGWQGFFSRVQHWSVQPCVRPLSAVHMTAGHNALRGSGPGQELAFDNAVAHVGCPDRRIDRLCITCCSAARVRLGTRPIQAEKSLPDRNIFGSATLATRAVANAGPTPGMSSSRRLASLDRCQALIMRSNSSI